MKKTKFNEEQIAMALHLAEQTSVEDVTRKLKALVADLSLDKKSLTPAFKREHVNQMVEVYGASIREACRALLLQRSVYFYRSCKDEQALLRMRIKEIVYSRTYYGYRRIHTLLQREWHSVNIKRVYRLYREENLQMRRHKPKRRVQAQPRQERMEPQHPNHIWSMDFLSDALFVGEKLRILAIVDAFTRLSPDMGIERQLSLPTVLPQVRIVLL